MERNYSIDFIKFFAIWSVVFIHTNLFSNELGFVLQTFSRFAVPFFFMSSGYLFSQKTIDTKYVPTYLKKYLSKLIKIYVCWVGFYFLYDIVSRFIQGTLKSDIGKLISKQSILHLLYYGDSTSGFQLWYLTALIWSILIISIFAYIKKIKLLFFLSLGFNLIGLFGESYKMFFNFSIETGDALFFGLFYTTLGYYIGTNITRIKELKINASIFLLLFLFFSLTQMVERYLLITKFSQPVGSYFISTPFLSFALFVFILKNNKLGEGSIFNKIGANSLGIYVIHVFFIGILSQVLKYLNLENLNLNIYWQVIYPIIIFVISYFAYEGIKQIKMFFNTNKLFKIVSSSKLN